MRRSTIVTLTLLAGSGVAFYALTGGEPDVDTVDTLVEDETACIARFGPGTEADCRATLAQARAQHLQTAPRFETLAACAEATGSACETVATPNPPGKVLAPSLASVAVPVMAGVLIGRMWDNGQGRMATPVYAGRMPAECGPGMPAGAAGCQPAGGGSSGSSGGRYYYSGRTYAGSGGASVGRGAVAFNASPGMSTAIATPARVGTASVARGGFGASARGFSSGS